MTARLRFLGATGTVTGSKYVLTNGPRLDDCIMIDCGLFQGLKDLRERNWQPLPIEPPAIGAVVMTHAHIDHCGYLPRLCHDGFSGPIYSTPGTAKLLEFLLMDSAHLQQEEALYANRKGFSKHHPALPLYTVEDVQKALQQVRIIPYWTEFLIGKNYSVRFTKNGHILGSAAAEITLKSESGPINVVFSGDIGRYGAPIMPDPLSPKRADYLVIESTYGDRTHSAKDPAEELREVIVRTTERHGSVVIPAFTVGRTQALLYVIRELEAQQLMPSTPIYTDSPMGIDITMLYRTHREELDPETRYLLDNNDAPFTPRQLISCRSREESIALNEVEGGVVIISSSGMATGGRILFHLARRLPDARNTVLLVGFQAEGTRGRDLLNGAKRLKIHGSYIPVNAEVVSIDGFSAHADASELITWLSRFLEKPRQIFITHGEPCASQALGQRIQSELQLSTSIPEYNQEVILD